MNKVLSHSDEVSGTSILPNDIKVYWTEGRSSVVVILYPDGRKEKVKNGTLEAAKHPVLKEMEKIEANGYDSIDYMSEADEDEWEKIRNS